MKCNLCRERFDPDFQTPICPHGLVSFPVQNGGFRLSAELVDKLEEAYETRDVDTLRQYAYSPNPLVARLANARMDALQMVVKLDQGLGETDA